MRHFSNRERAPQGPRVNHRIRIPQVRLVDADGSMVGVVDTPDALRKARTAGLDLVEVNPKAYPPVCKIMDFGKFKYEEKKRTAEARKRQATVDVKEIKVRPKTDGHDLDFKVKHVLRFLEEGNKVKITCRFRGREITHPEMAARPLRFIVDRTKDVATVEVQPRMDGRTMTLILAPGTKGGSKAKPARDLSIPTPSAPPPAPPFRRR